MATPAGVGERRVAFDDWKNVLAGYLPEPFRHL